MHHPFGPYAPEENPSEESLGSSTPSRNTQVLCAVTAARVSRDLKRNGTSLKIGNGKR